MLVVYSVLWYEMIKATVRAGTFVHARARATSTVLFLSLWPNHVDDFQAKGLPKHAHFNKNQPKILTAKMISK